MNLKSIPKFLILFLTALLYLSLASCGESVDSGTQTSSIGTAEGLKPTGTTIHSTEMPSETPVKIPSQTPSATPEPSPTRIPVPFEGEPFIPEELWDDVIPVTYLDDGCGYLQMRWDPEKSPPGTIVAPIMFHSVRKSGRPITDETSISEEYFHAVLTHAKDLGFETITTEELIAFLTSNTPIPPRSMVMILDDRRPGVTERFLPYLKTNDWTLTLGWIIEDQRDYLWDWMELLAESERLDVQSHGYWHRYIEEETSEEIIREELFNPIPILEEHFGYRPIAFIWPGGNFTERSVKLAHEAGYQIAFGAYAHGPLLFNWIPQTEEEIAINDPVMTLPRFWSTVAWRNLDETVRIAEAARNHALQQYEAEAEWYRQSCGSELPLPPE